MADSQKNLPKFWNELKRRNVIRVITAYAASAFIILQVVSIIVDPLHLPEWTLGLVLILLCIGFVLSIIFSWIYDYTPEGIKKTESQKVTKGGTQISKATKRKFRLSDIIIAVLLVVVMILLYPKIFQHNNLKKFRSKGKISIVVMPFQNMANDTIWNVWQKGIQDMLITSFSNYSEELTVRQTESINDLIRSDGLVNYASITPSFASNISKKLDADIFICGNIKKAGSVLRVYAQLIDSRTETVFKSFQIEDTAKEENIFKVIDSLSLKINNYLIISKLTEEGNPAFITLQSTTKAPEAVKLAFNGDKAFYKLNYPVAIEQYKKAIEVDSNYIYPAIMIAFSLWNQRLDDEGKEWSMKVFEKKDQLPLREKIYANIMHSVYFETPYETISYLRQLLEIDDQLPDAFADIGFFYYRLGQYDRAIPELLKSLKIYKKWGVKPLWSSNYDILALSYHYTLQYKKMRKLLEKAEKDFPDDIYLLYDKALLSLDEDDTTRTDQYIDRFISSCKDNSWPESRITFSIAEIYEKGGAYDRAEKYYRNIVSSDPQKPGSITNLAYFLIDKERNIDEGLDLANRALEIDPDNFKALDTKGWGLFKQGKYKEALEVLLEADSLKPVYDHNFYLHLEAVQEAVARERNLQ